MVRLVDLAELVLRAVWWVGLRLPDQLLACVMPALGSIVD